MQLDNAMVPDGPYRWINANSAAAIGAAPIGKMTRRVKSKPATNSDAVSMRRLTWGQFYALTDRKPPEGFAPDHRPANDNRKTVKRPWTDEQRAASRLRIAAERERVERLVADYVADTHPRGRKGRYRGGYPLLRVVLKDNPAGAWSMSRAIARSSHIALNDNHRAIQWMGSDDHEPEGPDREPLSPESIHDIRPSINQMMADILRVRVTRTMDGQYIRSTQIRLESEQRIVLADMVFSTHPLAHRPAGGLMVAYGTDAHSKPKLPAIKAEKPRGGYTNRRVAQDVSAYLALPGFKDGRVYMMEPPALPPMLDQTPHAQASQRNLAQWTANTRTMPTITKCPTAIAKGALFLGGIKKPKPSSTPDVWERDDPDVASLSEMARRVVEIVGSRGNLKRLGVSFGYSESYADRPARRILDVVTAEVMALIPPPPANDSMRRPAAA